MKPVKGMAFDRRDCFVVIRSRRDSTVLCIGFEFSDVKEFTLTHNFVSSTGTAVIRRGEANVWFPRPPNASSGIDEAEGT